MSASSPRPWRACLQEKGGCVCGFVWSVPADAPIAQALRGNDEEGYEYPPGTVEANAALIARAVNAHDELLEALRLCREYVHGNTTLRNAEEAMEAAIAKATGGDR